MVSSISQDYLSSSNLEGTATAKVILSRPQITGMKLIESPQIIMMENKYLKEIDQNKEHYLQITIGGIKRFNCSNDVKVGNRTQTIMKIIC